MQKRALDVVVAAAALAVLSVPMLAVAAVVRVAMGAPVLFRQVRPGRGGEPFTLLKFRTMRPGPGTDAERLTPIGRWLRRTSVDELPELWNVLVGDMSLVGPRPLPLDEAPLIASNHFARRQNVRPGITGPWQIHGRSDIPFEDMVKLDYTYVSTWSLQEDLRLLIRTVGVVAGGRGAY